MAGHSTDCDPALLLFHGAGCNARLSRTEGPQPVLQPSALDKLTPAIRNALWRISPATFAMTLTRNDPQPWVAAAHLKVLSQWIVDAVAGRRKRIIINMPPRHGKSELISKWTPVWFLDNYPHLNVINCGYGNDFAREWGRKTKELVGQHQGTMRFSLSQDSRASDRWNTKQGGGMKTAGIGGGITGRGAHLMIIDDPIKDDAEANSLLERDRIWNWWRGTARTRLEPDACVILCMTRWHDDDLAGRLIKAGEKGEGEVWEVLNLPALAEDGDVLGRKPGEALWPARYDLDALMALMSSVGPENWAAQFQGHPANLVSIGNVYKQFNKVQNVRPCAFDPRRPLVWSLDFNVDPMCSAICQWHEETTPFTLLNNKKKQVISVLQEVCLPNSSTQEACEEFVNRTEQYRRIMGNRPLQVRLYGDRSGQSRKTVGDSDYVAIRDFFKMHPEYRVVMHLSRANPAVKDRVNAVNAMLCNALGEVRTYIDPACTELIRDFAQVQWKRDSGGNTTGQIDKSDMSRTHVSDAYGYFVAKEFGLKAQSGGFAGIAQ